MDDLDRLILDPTGSGDAAPDLTLAPRLTTLRGTTLGLLDNGKPNASSLLDEVGDHLRRHYHVREVKSYTKGYFGTPVEQSLIQRILHNCDFVVAGIGD